MSSGTPGEDRIRTSVHEAGHAVALNRLSFPARLLNVTITGTPHWRGRVRFRRNRPSVYAARVARELDQQLHDACCLLRQDEVAAKRYALQNIVASGRMADASLEVERLFGWLRIRARKAEAHDGIVPWRGPHRRLARALAMDEAMVGLAGWAAEEVAFNGADEGYLQDYDDAVRLARHIVPPDEVEPFVTWLAVWVRSLLKEQWWQGVEALANKLREADSVSGSEAETTICSAFGEEDPLILLGPPTENP
jgi:hypothetical protein